MMIDAIKPWAQAVLTTGAAVATVMSYAFATFETKGSVDDLRSTQKQDTARIEKTIDRLEDKIDALLLKEGVAWQRQREESRRR